MWSFFKKLNSDSLSNAKKEFQKKFNRVAWEDEKLVESLIQQAIQIEEGSNESLRIGVSKIGGTPDLPENIEWPKYNNKSMLFFAQLNFQQLSGYHSSELLPKSGMIYFFSYFDEPENEYSFLKQKNEYNVLFSDVEESKLRFTPFPEDIIEDLKFDPIELTFKTFFQLPATIETSVVENMDLSENDLELLMEFEPTLESGSIGQILGYPVPVQYGVDYDFALSFLNIDLEKGEEQSKSIEIENIRPKFITLLTMDLFEPLGDSNCYFGILDEDLKKKDFGKTVFVMQSS